MIRRRIARRPASFSLFPFLAVLVCTMGALIVLLVLVVQQARVQAEAAEQRREETQQQRIELQDFEWRREVLETQRRELTARLGDKRRELSHLEDHIRRLQRRARQLVELAREADGDREVGHDELAKLKARRDELRSSLTDAQRQLEQMRAELADTPPSYAIVPYRGPHGTHRRPIYIECTADSIIVRPADVKLTAEDFSGPLGPGNPLDAALRAIREYWESTGQRTGEPYPLLIVRPDGTTAYNAARAALRAWDDEFGYELVDGQMKIEFPPEDPHLAQRLDEVIKAARMRQKMLIAAMPSKYGHGPTRGLVASPNGGFESSPVSPGDGREGLGSGHDLGGFGQGSDRRFGQRLADRGDERPEADESPGGNREPAARSADDPRGGDGTSAGNGPAGGRPLADKRGGNWALPKSSPAAIAVTRPIRVVCAVDRVTILPDPGSSARATAIPVGSDPTDNADRFVAEIWKHMDDWGIAIAGGYWKPVIKVEVLEGAERRCAELERSMKDSGIEFERRKP